MASSPLHQIFSLPSEQGFVGCVVDTTTGEILFQDYSDPLVDPDFAITSVEFSYQTGISSKRIPKPENPIIYKAFPAVA